MLLLLPYTRARFCLSVFFIFIFHLSFSIFNYSHAQTTFEKWYDYGAGEQGNCVQQTTDGGYIIAGVQIVTVGVSNNLLIKTDSLGNVTWFKLFSNGYESELHSVKQTNDGGYILSGYTSIDASYFDYTSLVKTDSNGDTVWTKKYIASTLEAGYTNNCGYDVLQTTDGSYVILVATVDDVDTLGTALLIKTNSNGDTIWTKKYKKGIYELQGLSLKQTSDGGFVMAGYIVLSLSPVIDKPYLIKTDSNGDTLWTKVVPCDTSAGATFIYENTNGGYFIGGNIGLNQYHDWDIFGASLNIMGDTLWTKHYGGTKDDRANSGQKTKEKGFVFSGSSDSYSAGGDVDVFLVNTDSSGNTLWQKTFGSTGDDYGNYVQQTKDGGYIITGSRISDAYLIKTDSAGNVLGTGVFETSANNSPLLVYPNPFITQTTILLPKRMNTGKEKTIVMLDVFGREAARRKIYSNDNAIILQREDLPSGVYLLQLFSGTELLGTAKIIMQ